MQTLGGLLGQHVLRAQGPPTLWGWTLERPPFPPQRRRPRVLQENLDWTVRRRVTMMMREYPEAWDRG